MGYAHLRFAPYIVYLQLPLGSWKGFALYAEGSAAPIAP
jgi:hypothetical protein